MSNDLTSDHPIAQPTPRGRRWQPLARRSDFLRIAASGLKRVTPGFILQAAPRGVFINPKLCVGFTASRKVGNAVARNRAKRRLRALADQVLTTPAVNAGMDYVLIGRPETLIRDFAAMADDLRAAVKKIGAGKKT